MEYEEERKSVREELSEIKDILESNKKKKPKKFRLPFKARVNKSKLRKGYITVETMNENKNIEFSREPIIDGTIKLGDTFHAVEEHDIFFYKGKPFIHLAKNKLNPWNPLSSGNETYGQKYIMGRMKTDVIMPKKTAIKGVVVIGILIAIAVGYYVVTGGFG